ncbi:hypothetical protein [Allosphingosinicella sp.]|jgi:hypothetical protein|uniref:hypothetical protein n=1 Tax=Allosphingosinicella sp. TaxID=2823234 RepID=UPI002EE47E16
MRSAMLLGAALLVSGADSAREPRTLTRAQVRDLSDEELSRRLFGDIGQIMFPLRFGERRGPVSSMPLQALQFLSRPRGTYRVGICETDRVTVYFERAVFSAGDDPAVVPRRFEVTTNYFVRDLPLALEERSPDTDDGEERIRLDRECAQIDPREANIVIARNDSEVATAVVMIASLAAAAREGRTPAATECRDRSGEPMDSAACLQELARMDARSSMAVWFNPACARADAAVYCRQIEFIGASESRQVLFELRRGSREPVRVIVETVPEP